MTRAETGNYWFFWPNVVKNYRPITISSVHTKAIESFIIHSAEISDNLFGFRENRGTAFACNLLNDVTSYCKSRNSSLFLPHLTPRNVSTPSVMSPYS